MLPDKPPKPVESELLTRRPDMVGRAKSQRFQLLLQLDELNLQFDHGVCDDARCQGCTAG